MRQSSFNPLHCGAVVTSLNAPLAARRGGKVSIPFIAGQWSLLYPLRDVKPRDTLCFNPLHCGAVVTSPSRALRRARRRGAFQSPSLRGSGHFALAVRRLPSCPFCFNPLHCGAVVASCGRCGRRRRRRPVSIPFIAGQWSLPGGTPPDPIRIGRGFQSPSLRGSGRFERRKNGHRGKNPVSIPFIAGQWSLRFPARDPLYWSLNVSIPFIAGQWSLL